MASGTLPEPYDAKEIGGRKFWDGGVLSNTPLRESYLLTEIIG